jgi:hypothetical protein
MFPQPAMYNHEDATAPFTPDPPPVSQPPGSSKRKPLRPPSMFPQQQPPLVAKNVTAPPVEQSFMPAQLPNVVIFSTAKPGIIHPPETNLSVIEEEDEGSPAQRSPAHGSPIGGSLQKPDGVGQSPLVFNMPSSTVPKKENMLPIPETVEQDQESENGQVLETNDDIMEEPEISGEETSSAGSAQ